MTELGLVLLIVLLLILLNGLFVAAEFAVIASSRANMAARAEAGDSAAASLVHIMKHPALLDRYVATAQLGITFASLGLGMYGEQKLSVYVEGWLIGAGFTGLDAWLSAHAVAVVIVIMGMTYLHIVLGEMIPKSLAISRSAATALWVLRPMQVIGVVLHPLVVALNWSGNRLLGLVGFRRGRGTVHSTKELEWLARQSQASGMLGNESARVFQELVEFPELTAAEAMVPRVRVTGLPVGASCEDIAGLVGQRTHTRYPVFERDLDHIVGTVHVRNLLDALSEGRPLQHDDIRETAYLPENASLDDVLAAMQRVSNQMIVVMDEHGGTAGTLTMEDLYIEIVGVVEHSAARVSPIVALSGGRSRVQGTVRLNTLGDALGLELDHPEIDTISGLVIAELGRPPRVGDRVVWRALRFDVMRLHGRGVAEVIVQPWQSPSGTDA